MSCCITRKICLSLSSENFLRVENNLSKFDGFIFEVRMDLFADNVLPEKILKSGNRIILTCRGDNCDIKKKIEWAEMTHNLLAIDVAYNSLDFSVLGGYPLLVSYHDYDTTPDFDALLELYEKLRQLGAEYVKIVTSDYRGDFKRLLNLYHGAEKERLIAFTMGKTALISRVEALRRGAPFVFAAPDKESPVFAGQPYYEDIIKLYDNE